MRAANADDIRRIALNRGAQAVIGGRAFNAERQSVVSLPKLKAAPVTPTPIAPPEPPTLTVDTVERLVTQRMAQLEGQLHQAMTAQGNAMALAMAAALKNIETVPGKAAAKHQVKVKYDDFDRITDMTITPVY